MDTRAAPRGTDWAEIVDALHGLTNTMTVRSHYPEGHPAIARVDENAGTDFTKVLARVPEVVLALIEGELVICDRPFPGLHERLHVLTDAMVRHQIGCIVFQSGMRSNECARLGRALTLPEDAPGRVRETAQSGLAHILLRFADLTKDGGGAATGTSAFYFVPLVATMLAGVVQSFVDESALDLPGITALATDILSSCSLRTFSLTQRCWTRTSIEPASHATNVAMMAGAMALEAGLPQTISVDVVAAALLHDVGHLLLPEAIAGLPEPLLEEQHKPLFRNHTFAGASALLASGAPPLWVAAALEHHRGVDGGGYPALEAKVAPHELVRMIGLANFFDRKRTLLEGRRDTPEEIYRQALALEDRYFGRHLLERFVHALGVYPPGTTVELSNRQPALVLAPNRNDPWRPRVMLLRGPDEGKGVDLKDLSATLGQHHVSIVRSIDPPLLVFGDVVPTDPTVPQREASPPSDPLPSAGFLDGLVVPAQVLVTSPPPAPSLRPTPASAPPARTTNPPLSSTYSSTRPLAVEETITVSPRYTSGTPIGRPLPARSSAPPTAPVALSEEELLTALGSLSSVPRRTGAAATRLDPRGAFLLGFIDGMSTVEDIADISGLPRRDVLEILHALLANATITVG